MSTLLGGAVAAAYHIVSAFAYALAPVAGGLATALAIVAFTVAVRLLLLPLSYYAIRGQASQARLLPQVQDLRKRHAGHPDRLQRELTALYQREGSGMFAGCLPALLQLPFFSVMYQLFRSARLGGRPNGLLGHDLLGVPLGSHWLTGAGPFSAPGLVFLGLFALLAGAAWAAARIARRARPDAPPAAVPAGGLGFVTRVLPYTTVAIAAIMPLAAGLYLLTTTAWALGERALLGRRMRPPAAPDPGPAAPARGRMYGSGPARHDEGSTRGGRPCISRPSRTSPAKTRRSPS